MQQVLLIALGGSLGSVARYGVSTLVYTIAGEGFPFGTLVVNITGSFLIGFVAELIDATLVPSAWRSMASIGFIGGYTTFSTYTFETLTLVREGEVRLATLNVVGNNVLGLLLAAFGIYACRILVKLFLCR
jgi:CrcB protein